MVKISQVTARFAAASAPPHAVAAAEASPVGRQCVCFSAADRVQWRGGVRGEDDTHRQYRLHSVPIRARAVELDLVCVDRKKLIDQVG